MNAQLNAARTDLFDPVQVGDYRLANRIVMAPLTRSRAHVDGTANALMAEYYAQRASAGLIIAEGTNISPQGRGYAFTPGIYSASQVEAWRPVTQAIHAKGSRVFVQLWHVGRISHPSLQPNGALPVAPSAILPEGSTFTESGYQSLRHAPGARVLGNCRRHCSVCARGASCDRRGLRRGRDPCGQRLSDRSVFARQHQPAHRRLRRLAAKPDAIHARGGCGSGGCMRRRTRRHSPFTGQPGQRRRSGQRPDGHVRLRGRSAERLPTWLTCTSSKG